METNSEKNKRIAKNTLALYFRTFITMVVGIYTGRILLEALGIENYGIQVVVGGIIAMSGIITSSMNAACGRYITYYLGIGNLEKSKDVFCTCVNAQIILAIIAAIVLETLGVWFLNTTANIPLDRLYAANWIFHCSIIALVFGVISVPYSATIIAHEHMSIYAYMSIVDVTLKLMNCFIIKYYDGDRLILYSILTVVQAFFLRIFYGWYCTRKFSEVRYRFHVDWKLLKALTSYSGWNLVSHAATMLNVQGVSMLVNVYFGVVFNSARGVALTVSSCVQNFVNNFSVAFNPQITKSYAQKDYKYMLYLAFTGIRIIWFLILVFMVPICIEAEQILSLWLTEVPPLSATFLRLSMFETLAMQTGYTLVIMIMATGNIKRYQIEVALYGGLVFPLTWISFYLGGYVWLGYVYYIFIYFTLNWVRFKNLKKLIPEFSVKEFFYKIYYPCIKVSLLAFSVPLAMSFFLEASTSRLFIMVPCSVLWTILMITMFGLTKSEKDFFKSKLMRFRKFIPV